MADSGRSGGRGRGRARTGEQPPAAPPPGTGPPQAAAATDIGRRGTTGRRADAASTTAAAAAEGAAAAQPPAPVAKTITPPEKPQRGSPADTGSPNGAAARAPSVPSPSDVEKMQALELISLSPRPGYGKIGDRYRIYANHFEVQFKEKVLMVNHYHIEISHQSATFKPNRDDNRPILWQCMMTHLEQLGMPNREELFKVAYDGMGSLYTLNPLRLPRENLIRLNVDLIIPRFDKPTRFTVLIQATGPQPVDLRQVVTPVLGSKVLTPIQILDIIIRQYRSNPILDMKKCFYPFRNSVFMIPGSLNAPGGVDLGAGREIWKGLFTSAHVGQNYRAFVNMDVVHTAFFKMMANGGGNGNNHYTAIMYLCDVLNAAEGGRGGGFSPAQIKPDTSIDDRMTKIFEREIKGLRICMDYNRLNSTNREREYRVMAVDKPATQVQFTTKEGVTKTVAGYFNETYGQLRYPNMPTLKVGSKSKSIHLPIEHCYLAKCQKVNKKLSEMQTATMIKQTCMQPADRKRSIEQMAHFARFGDDPFLNNFGVQMKNQMVGIEGRILPAPGITYANNQPCQVKEGVWRGGGMKFHMPATALGIAAVAFQRAPNEAQDFVNRLLQTCNQCGMRVPNPSNVFFHLEQDNSAQRVEKALQFVVQAMKKNNITLSLIIVFIPVKGHPLYPEVKRVAEIQLGIMTQCVTNKTVQKLSPDTLFNIVFKVNMKLGGINCQLSVRDAATRVLFNEPTFVLGIDVTHPGPTDKRSPSVASVVGSMDDTYMRYAASIKIQKQRRESLVYLSDPVTDRLMYHYKATKAKPTRIIVYRDGVSEGEFGTILREELRGIRASCLKVDPSFKPKITFIVVQKRHHTRLFPADPNQGSGRAKNVFPGSVVDTDILFHEDFNFYLCSHQGIQGTSRPTRYHVLHDDNNFSADDLQCMTYHLCHCFSRCTRVVSIPAPVYYAHLACTRARAHMQSVIGDALSDTVSVRSGEVQTSSIPEEELIRASTVEENVRMQMYFT